MDKVHTHERGVGQEIGLDIYPGCLLRSTRFFLSCLLPFLFLLSFFLGKDIEFGFLTLIHQSGLLCSLSHFSVWYFLFLLLLLYVIV